MCQTQQAYHSVCGHWAKYPELIQVCAIAQKIPGWSKGCANAVSYGMVTRHTHCPACIQAGHSSQPTSASSTPQRGAVSNTSFTPTRDNNTGNGQFDTNAFNNLVKRHNDHFSRRSSVTSIFSFASDGSSTSSNGDCCEYRSRQDSMFSIAEAQHKPTAVLEPPPSWSIINPSVPRNLSPPISPKTVSVKDAIDEDVDYLFALFG